MIVDLEDKTAEVGTHSTPNQDSRRNHSGAKSKWLLR